MISAYADVVISREDILNTSLDNLYDILHASLCSWCEIRIALSPKWKSCGYPHKLSSVFYSQWMIFHIPHFL